MWPQPLKQKPSLQPSAFSPATFKYFEAARKNKKNTSWFEENRFAFEGAVRNPFEELTTRLDKEFGDDLPKIDFLPRKISRPVRRKPDQDGGLVRTNATAYFAEKTTSQFEWNPGIYISIGASSEDNVFGLGLYMVSSRQMSLLRSAIVNDFDKIDSLLRSKKLVQRWGSLTGDVYKRFPKGFDEASAAAKYLRHKQFFLGQDLSNREICKRTFFDTVVKDVEVSMPFLVWVRGTVGVYKKIK